MEFLSYTLIPFVIVLGVLIFFHELGHFLAAKAFGIKVLTFSLGFGPRLVGKRLGETEYVISLVPLGGYVKMLGESADEEENAPLPPEEEARSFSHKPVLQRMVVVASGPIFNLILAMSIFCMLFLISGVQVLKPEVGQVREGSPAQRAGLMPGDRIKSVEGQPIHRWEEIREAVQGNAGRPLRMTVLRGGETLTFTVVPEHTVIKNLFGEEVPAAVVGIVAAGTYQTLSLPPWAALREGLAKTWDVTRLTCLTVVKLIQRTVPLSTLGGPLLIGQMTGELAREDLSYLIPFTAVISINLGILNLFPIPILDGGLLVFLLIELVTGRPLTLKRREMAQKVGLFLLFVLMAVVIYNDLVRLLK